MPDDPNEMKLPKPKFSGTATNTPPPTDDDKDGE